MIAIIGGSGLSRISTLEPVARRAMRTPYGEPSGALTVGKLNGHEVLFLARHGYGHTIPPHEVNYRANIWALREAGATKVISVASVGGIRVDLGPGLLVVPDQIIDYTWGRPSTFFEGGDQPVTHVDFTHPFAQATRELLLASAVAAGEPIADGATYGATQGPRLETAAEIDRLERDGADLVGMTGMPEAVLARELGLEYAMLAVVANYAAGRAKSARGVDLSEIEIVLHAAMTRARKILEAAVGQVGR